MTRFYIVTPVYNGAQYINTAITHIVSQAGNFEIYYHVQDGGSTDETLNILNAWEQILKSNSPLVQCKGVHFSWSSENDEGIYDAINRGFATFDIPDDGIMGWCNADDMYLPMIFANLKKVLHDLPQISFIAGEWRFWENNILYEFPYHKGPYPQDLMQNFCCDFYLWSSLPQPSVFWKGELWKKTGPLNASMKYAGDFEYWQRLSQHAECAYLPLSMSICTRHPDQLGKQRPDMDSPTFYELEKEQLYPLEQRKAYMRTFWKKHFFPPKGRIISAEEETYFTKVIPCWPPIWNAPSLAGYFRRRLLYYYHIIRTKLMGSR